MPQVKLTASAQADLEDIHSYIAEGDEATANKVIGELLEKFRLLSRNVALGRARNELIFNLRSFPHRRYIVFYFPLDDGIEIYRVLHGAQDIEEIFEGLINNLLPTAEE